mgnify:CR=1 FL=1|jgi:Sphingosine kinase and enzymes related to eukaryotic diacylglycerol kinase
MSLRMRIALIYNPSAGQEDHTEEDLVERLEAEGHEVRCETTKSDRLQAIAKEPVDVVIAAGGDGTVRRVTQAFAGRGVPMSILPLGTANNIARTLSLYRAEEEIVRALRDPDRKQLDLGVADGPWGAERFVEGFGTGLLAEYLARLEAVKPKQQQKRAEKLLRRMAKEFPSAPVGLWIDGENFSGEYFLVEVMNIRSIGPFAGLAPDADPGDGELDIVLLGEAERGAFSRYAKRLVEKGPALHPFSAKRCRRIELAWTGQPLHVDDSPWPPRGAPNHGKITLTVESGVFQVLRPKA